MAHPVFCSGKQVLAKVIRATGNKLPSVYFDDVMEWIPEAIDLLSNTKTMETASTGNVNCGGALEVKNHQVCLPKDLLSVLAVEDEFGFIIPEGGDISDVTNQSSQAHRQTTADTRVSTFAVNPLQHQTSNGTPTSAPGTTIPLYGSDLENTASNSCRGSYYKLSGNYLQLSFETGFVKIHYLRRPLDKEGYPLIPDNENFKTALMWYVLMMLIGAGYQHPVHTFDKCQAQFEMYGGRAINEITYPSLDATSRVNRTLTGRIIPPLNAYNEFFI